MPVLSLLSKFSARSRLSWLISFCALPMLLLGGSRPALAQCAFVGGPFTLDCSTGGNPYTTNINLNGGPTDVLSLTLEPGVIVESPGGNAVNAANTTGPSSSFAGVSLTANNANVTNTSNPAGANNTGLRIQSAGDAIITATGAIAVTGVASDWAILDIGQNGAPATGGTVMVTYGQPGAPGLGLRVGSLAASAPGGLESGGIQADDRGNGDAIINAWGDITGFAGAGNSGFYGLIAHADDTESTPGGSFAGDAKISYHSGTINLTADGARGILAWSQADGSVAVTTDPGTTIIVDGPNLGGPGVYLYAGAATAASGRTVTANVASEIMSTGPAAFDLSSRPWGIRAVAVEDAPISVTYTGLGITTRGGNGIGIGAISGSGSIGIDSSGPITTNGPGAFGIFADSGGGPVVVTTSGRITTVGPESHGIVANSTSNSVQVTAANVSTTGEFSTAINATSTAAAATPAFVRNLGAIPIGGPAPFITGSSAISPGRVAISGGDVTVHISPGGSIMGGWQSDVESVGPISGLPAAGVILSSAGGTATLINDGDIGALSDRAVAGDPQIVNNGTITGFTQFSGVEVNSIENNGTFNLRHFADTTGALGGVRDTVRVATADLGAGANNTFTNNGTLRLLNVTGATTLDSAGQYLPVANRSLGDTSNAMALGGPLQGQIIGVRTFTNSGVIDLQSNPAAGDVMMITGGRGGSTPGTGGGGAFISNGGSLLLDTVLNQGGAATVSDTLVVDGTSVGPKGATQMFIRSAGGDGGLTVGDGILVVEALNQAKSPDGAFALADEVAAGPFEYRLFHGGVGGSNPGDWFLRNEFVTPPIPPEPPIPPVPPFPPTPPPHPLPPGVYPIIGPRLATYGVAQPLARQLGLDILGTLHERAGDTYEPDCARPTPAAETSGVDLPTKKPAALPTKKSAPAPCPLFSPSGWARFFGGTFNDRYQAFADPRADGNFWGFQGGVDLLRGPLIGGGYDRAGLYGAFGNSNANVDGLVTNPAATAYILTRTGSVNLDAWSGGAYWTHVGPSGWYLDTVLQGTS